MGQFCVSSPWKRGGYYVQEPNFHTRPVSNNQTFLSKLIIKALRRICNKAGNVLAMRDFVNIAFKISTRVNSKRQRVNPWQGKGSGMWVRVWPGVIQSFLPSAKTCLAKLQTMRDALMMGLL